jgi:hypothetical protein
MSGEKSLRRRRCGVLTACFFGLLLAGCQRPTPAATDPTSLQKHVDELKKQHQRELQNK